MTSTLLQLPTSIHAEWQISRFIVTQGAGITQCCVALGYGLNSRGLQSW